MKKTQLENYIRLLEQENELVRDENECLELELNNMEANKELMFEFAEYKNLDHKERREEIIRLINDIEDKGYLILEMIKIKQLVKGE